jgi:hypothetical protein
MTRRRRRRISLGALGSVALLGANAPLATHLITGVIHRWEVTQPGYERHYGLWQTLEFPTGSRVNSVHAALLNTGKVLLMAGSGNVLDNFQRDRFRTLEWDPSNNHLRLVPTPSDVFCGGHAFLADGRLLVAGGTQRYEVLVGQVTHAGGPMTVANATGHAVTLPKWTPLLAPDGRKYLTDVPITVPAGRRVVRREAAAERRVLTRRGRQIVRWLPAVHRRVRVEPGLAEVWVDAVRRGRVGLQRTDVRYAVEARPSLYGVGGAMTMKAKQYQGTNLAYEFNPGTQRYDAVQRMTHKRWYPTLVQLSDGEVLAVSGLDGVGNLSTGQSEVFNPRTQSWHLGPSHFFPTYPSLLLMEDGELFYSGANQGYGPRRMFRASGLWNVKTDSFRAVPELRFPQEVDNAATVLLPPAQRQSVMILGGGTPGETRPSTRRTAIIDLRSADPAWRPGPALPHQTRYPLAVTLPDDTVFVTGGSRFYRGEHASDNRDAEIYHPSSNSFTPAAAPEIGRDYHSEALLLPDGRVATFGSNPLFSPQADSLGDYFEQRVEIYSPPYLFRGTRPRITGGPRLVYRGSRYTFTIPHAGRISALRLIHPGAYTHVTDTGQRSVAIGFTARRGRVRAAIPQQPGLLPSGWYMLFAVDRHGVPSVARWVRVR